MTENAISAAHDQNKKMLVWTLNEKSSQKHFLCSNADGLITDNVSQEMTKDPYNFDFLSIISSSIAMWSLK